MKDLTKGNIPKLIIGFAIPILLGNVFQLLYNLADTRIVGELLGDDALAAVGSTNSINGFIIGFLIGLNSGFAIVVSKYYGAKDDEKLRKSIGGTVMLSLIITVLLTVLSLIFLRPLLRLLNTPEDVFDVAYSYIVIIFACMIICNIYNMCASILRALGDTFSPLVFLIVSTLVNIGLDYAFVGPLNMGVPGAAYATIASQLLSVILCLIYIYIRYPFLHLKLDDFKIDKDMFTSLISSGLSMGFMISLVNLGSVILQSSINSFGKPTIVAHTAARKLSEMYMIPGAVLSNTMATFCGQNYGAKEYERIRKGVKTAILICWIWDVIVIITAWLLAPLMIHAVTGSDSTEVIKTATLYLKIDTLFYFVLALVCILRSALQGIGDHTTPIVSSFVELFGKLFVVLLLTPVIHYMGIILAEPIVWTIMVIPMIITIIKNPIMSPFKNKRKTDVS